MVTLLNLDPVVQDSRAFFALLNWSVVEQWQEPCSSRRGRPAHPLSAYLKALLIRVREGFMYTTQLRRFLLKHPLLVIELGFRLELDPRQPYGFDVDKTLPCESWLREQLHFCDHDLLTALLQATIRDLQAAHPRLRGNRGLRRQAYLCLGQREQSARLRQRSF